MKKERKVFQLKYMVCIVSISYKLKLKNIKMRSVLALIFALFTVSVSAQFTTYSGDATDLMTGLTVDASNCPGGCAIMGLCATLASDCAASSVAGSDYYNAAVAVQTASNIVGLVVGIIFGLCFLAIGIIICCCCCAVSKAASDINDFNQQMAQNQEPLMGNKEQV